MSFEKRMYFFVPYNISPIQQAIQAGHASLEYALSYAHNPFFLNFAQNWKTWIILNGGTTNGSVNDDGTSEGDYKGTLDNIQLELSKAQIDHSKFYEPDLNDALTAVCFIADERVFNYKDYPDFHEWIVTQEIVNEDEKLASYTDVKGKTTEELKQIFPGMYPQWIRFLGGDKNVFLRELLKYKKLA